MKSILKTPKGIMERPNPGTEEAIKRGCKCPIVDNHYGEGLPSKDGPMFWYSSECELHVSGDHFVVV